ncbi:hypothetical protein WI61_26750 [Burkholderia cepacia]|uniref:DUF6708 domain-containing protein n=1 Tax=Burkholderia cepacia TaxID=292 RepID=UPI000753A7D6|nr:DUF6708 domain-containing protein [Burkholderia cepacia]KVA53451.1 hypothetical protein WI47_12585 [Burkholderia cepacia]KVA59078.1 hypothetical protein WI48_17170 [Burkholderia cepacia]KVA63682.1 hypothetical protein WI49_20515 [Burkholderia cepacia]KVA86072.1 hypothetical protein WI50_16355 [Burkholderia cepacia]KVA88556.1 hypothetical protein WI52_10900 [Burkholderia cepacia]
MAMTWRFSRQTRIGVAPAIRDQLVSVDRDVLCLRNAWVADSVFMGRMYTVGNAIMFVFLVYMFFKLPLNSSQLPGFDLLIWTYIVGSAVFLSFFVALTWYRVFFIKRLSNFYFNRKTRKVYYQRNKTLIAFDWAQTEGAEFVRNEFGGRSFSTNFALAFGPRPAPGDEQDRTVLWVDSNAPNDPDPRYIAEVWEYICQFMEKGPDHLPPPGEPNWWYVPLHRICLTPAEAWRHYAPWRSGEPGEWQGKKNWLLPMWLILFPYNLFSALCWYVVCRVFNVCSAPPPAEALER